jgi:catechol 2,3-dioxygenase-like lactoylglutathione lyase family enzyme
MLSNLMNTSRFQRVKVIALPVVDSDRANKFYEAILGLQPAYEGGEQVGYLLGDIILMLKANWYASPTQEPNPRITMETDDALQTERELRESGVAISDPVNVYDEFYVGAFLDSEGNKLWFCSPVKREAGPPAT